MIVTSVVFIIILLVLILSHEAGHFFSAKHFGIKVEEFGFGLPPRIKGIKKGNTIYSLNALPFGGFVKIFGEEGENSESPESFGGKPAWKKSAVLLAGVAANILLAYLAFSIISAWGVPESLNPSEKASLARASITIIEIAPESPAFISGIIPGDKIKKINGVAPDTIGEFQKSVEKNKSQKISIQFERNGEMFEKEIIPRANPPAGEGPLGVALSLVRIKKSAWYQAPINGMVITWNVAKGTIIGFLETIKSLAVSGKTNVQVAGPVGIFSVTGKAASEGISSLLTLVGILSINLAIINILPFPGLDGGRFLFVIIEKIRRKKISDRVSSWAHGLGLAILIILMLLITYRDIIRLFA